MCIRDRLHLDRAPVFEVDVLVGGEREPDLHRLQLILRSWELAGRDEAHVGANEDEGTGALGHGPRRDDAGDKDGDKEDDEVCVGGSFLGKEMVLPALVEELPLLLPQVAEQSPVPLRQPSNDHTVGCVGRIRLGVVGSVERQARLAVFELGLALSYHALPFPSARRRAPAAQPVAVAVEARWVPARLLRPDHCVEGAGGQAGDGRLAGHAVVARAGGDLDVGRRVVARANCVAAAEAVVAHVVGEDLERRVARVLVVGVEEDILHLLVDVPQFAPHHQVPPVLLVQVLVDLSRRHHIPDPQGPRVLPAEPNDQRHVAAGRRAAGDGGAGGSGRETRDVGVETLRSPCREEVHVAGPAEHTSLVVEDGRGGADDGRVVDGDHVDGEQVRVCLNALEVLRGVAEVAHEDVERVRAEIVEVGDVGDVLVNERLLQVPERCLDPDPRYVEQAVELYRAGDERQAACRRVAVGRAVGERDVVGLESAGKLRRARVEGELAVGDRQHEEHLSWVRLRGEQLALEVGAHPDPAHARSFHARGPVDGSADAPVAGDEVGAVACGAEDAADGRELAVEGEDAR
eukprot:711943-Hanusia_phi.AAC.6